MPKKTRKANSEFQGPLHFHVTHINRRTRMVVRGIATATSARPDGDIGPFTWPGPQYEDRSSTQRSRGERRTKIIPKKQAKFSLSRRNKGCNFVRGSQNDAKMKANTLCLKCQSIISSSKLLNNQADQVKTRKSPPGPLQRPEKLERFQHYSTFEELEQSCNAQCHLCHLLWDILDDQRSGEDKIGVNTTGKPVIVQLRNGDWKPNSPIHVNVALQKTKRRRIEDNNRRCILIHRLPISSSTNEADEEPDIASLLKSEHPAQLSVSTESDATFDLASQWLTACLSSHEVCRTASDEAMMLPSRLIWLSPPNLRMRAKLCRTTELAKFPPYFTLSHCWGGAEVTRLTKEVLTDFSRAIPFHDLPKTFKDAMVITRKLGYNYIWIDSLCIIQDDSDDWVHESAIMGQIYRNSTCNLAALGALDSNGGCFTTRNPLLHRPCRLSGDNKNELYAFGYGDPEEHTNSRERLTRRAWVFQERMLSPRTLYYGATAISWECIFCSATECQPHELPFDEEKEDSTLKRILHGIDGSLTVGMFRAKWSQIIEEYSRCDLTRETDRLSAIHGVVKELKDRLETAAYVAGVWWDDPFFSLLWHTYRPADHRQRTPYIAPSWSWACTGKHINFGLQPSGKYGLENFRGMRVRVHYNVVPMAQIIEVMIQSKHSGPRDNGQVDYGEIVLRASCKRVAWADFERPANSSRDSRDTNDVTLPDFQHSRYKPDEIWAVLLCTCIPRGFQHDLQDDGLDINARIDIGLMLGRYEDDHLGRKNVFERLGYFEQYYWMGDENIVFSRPCAEPTDLVLF